MVCDPPVLLLLSIIADCALRLLAMIARPLPPKQVRRRRHSDTSLKRAMGRDLTRRHHELSEISLDKA
jgi:hypothetical protein